MVRAVFGGGEKPDISSTSRVSMMSGDARGNGEKGSAPADEAALSARLKSLGQRLDQAGSRRTPETGPAPRSANDRAGLALGLRLSSELVAGVIVGAAIGWFLDRWLGTSPWGFIVFLLLGFVAGLLNLMRSAGLVAERQGK